MKVAKLYTFTAAVEGRLLHRAQVQQLMGHTSSLQIRHIHGAATACFHIEALISLQKYFLLYLLIHLKLVAVRNNLQDLSARTDD
jgi:hypothetical protein